jgi:hypothetical protein
MILTVINADGNKRVYSAYEGPSVNFPRYGFRGLGNGSKAIPVEFANHDAVYDDVEAMRAITRENLDEMSICQLEDG